MVFSSVPVYLDPPIWQQLPTDQQHGGVNTDNLQLPPLPPSGGESGGGTNPIKPGSMAERSRLAKIPQPETALKCPRCESTNTKFCYFNNYSLSQPRHFCKTCRRYWTRGGALRNVPVGGGCRRNRRSKSSRNRSKSPAVSDQRQTGSSSSSTTFVSNSCTEMLGHVSGPPQLPLLPPLHHLGEYNLGGIPVGGGGGGDNMDFQIEQWRSLQNVQQFPFLTNLEPGNGIYQPPLESAINQLAAVKMEESHNQGFNLSRNFLGISSGSDQFGNSWTDLSGFTTSTTHLL